MGIFNVLAVPLGIAMKWLYQLVSNYGWTIIIFTFLVRILMFPLSLKQQKSTARMSAYQPMIQELQKKWANDKNRQNAEMQKFYEENNIKMSAGCAPMLVNMLVLFGMIAVIQAPLTYIISIDTVEVNKGVAIVQYYEPESEIGTAGYTQQSILIGEMKTKREQFISGAEVPYVDDAPYILQKGESYKDGQIVNADGKVTQESASLKQTSLETSTLDAVDDFNFRFMGLNLADAPTLDNWVTLIMPILSILTMVASQLLIMKLSPSSQGRGQMLIMTVVFGVMFGFFAFRVPAGFSLYYTVSNVVMTLQQLVLKKIYDPEKIRAEVEAEIAERRAAKKTKKKVVVVDDASGEDIERELSESELNRLRLERARQLDAERYGGSGGKKADAEEAEEEAEDEKTAKARKLDEEKYGKADAASSHDDEAPTGDGEAEADVDSGAEEGQSGEEDETAEPNGDAAGAAETDDAQTQQQYKPGRRKRARQSREREKQGADDAGTDSASESSDHDEKED